MGLLVIWAMLGTVVAIIANSKGYDASGWFIYGALTGPIAFTHILVKPAKEREQSLSAGSQKKCPDCAEIIKRDAMVCRYCGNRSFPRAFESLSGSSPTPKPTTWQKLWWNPHAPDRRR